MNLKSIKSQLKRKKKHFNECFIISKLCYLLICAHNLKADCILNNTAQIVDIFNFHVCSVFVELMPYCVGLESNNKESREKKDAPWKSTFTTQQKVMAQPRPSNHGDLNSRKYVFYIYNRYNTWYTVIHNNRCLFVFLIVNAWS